MQLTFKSVLLSLMVFIAFPFSAEAIDNGSVQLEWPIISDNPMRDIQSYFGPRLSGCNEQRCYDFHRGVDFSGEIGDDIVSVAEGEVYRLYTEDDDDSPYPNGGNVVILRHTADEPFRFHNNTYSVLYSIYYHLDSIEPGLTQGDTIREGVRVGALGDTGSASKPHLHLEIRAGEMCSLASSCNTLGVDPHINPLRFFSYEEENVAKNVRVYRKKKAVRVEVTLPKEEFDLNSIQVYALSKKKKRIRKKRINYNTRRHINATSKEAIDIALYKGVKLIPQSVSSRSDTHTTTIAFQNMLSKKVKYVRVRVKDVKGNTIYSKRIRKSEL